MSQAERPRVLTMGYGDKTLPTFLEALDAHGVRLVVDVRAVAISSVEGFSEEELGQALAQEGIDYLHLGELGDFQPTPYPEYMTTGTWEQAYRELRDAAGQGGALVLCQCPDVGSCHRRFLQRALTDDGFKVVHLTPAGPREAVTLDQGS